MYFFIGEVDKIFIRFIVFRIALLSIIGEELIVDFVCMKLFISYAWIFLSI